MAGNQKKDRSHKSSSRKREEEDQKESKNYGNGSGYEKFREQRIKENLERMEKMGILDLSRNLRPPKRQKPPQTKPPLPPSGSPRRSSRLNIVTRVDYAHKSWKAVLDDVTFPTPKKDKRVAKVKKELKHLDNVEITIKEGSKPEIYTEEHEQLLGDCKTAWTLDVDGCDEDGVRMYDQFEGKHCHQCRQKALGHHTQCSKCKEVEGQFCGDCLFTRYGENVLEANENPSWTCPACRGICNCSRCRRKKGWEPTGSIYWKVEKLGFKSVAHYLIQTRRAQKPQEEPIGEEEKGSLPLADRETKPTDENVESQSDNKRIEERK